MVYTRIQAIAAVGILLICQVSYAQISRRDTAFIRPLARNNVLEASPGIYGTSYHFQGARRQGNPYMLKVNSSGYMSGYLNYKWLSVTYSFNIPGTQLDDKVKFRYTSFKFRISARNMVFQPFYDSYNGLLITQKKREPFKPFHNLQFRDAGFDYSLYSNTRRFSFRAGNTFSEQQVRSAGAGLIMITPMWQQIKWATPSADMVPDSSTYKLFSANPQWLSLVARAGYAYNIAWGNGKYLIAPSVLAGGGLLQTLHSQSKIHPVTDVQARVNAGYNGADYYCYLSAFLKNRFTYLPEKTIRQINTDLSVTVGYRFGNYRKKIIGLL